MIICEVVCLLGKAMGFPVSNYGESDLSFEVFLFHDPSEEPTREGIKIPM